MKYSLGISNFLQKISSLSYSIVFLYFFALIIEEGFLISPCYSLEPCIQIGISFLLYFAMCVCVCFSVICKASLDNHFAFLHFFFLGGRSWSLPPKCHGPLSIILQALCLSDPIPWVYLSLTVCSHKGIDLGHTWMA